MDELWHAELTGDPGLVPFVAEVIRSRETMELSPSALLRLSGYREGV